MGIEDCHRYYSLGSMMPARRRDMAAAAITLGDQRAHALFGIAEPEKVGKSNYSHMYSLPGGTPTVN